MNKKARFFCDFCNTEVKANAKKCGHCGKFFSSVRCPKCGKTGHQSLFMGGCPICGYASSFSSGKSVEQTNKKQVKKDFVNDSLPVWLYIVITCVLLSLIIFLFTLLK